MSPRDPNAPATPRAEPIDLTDEQWVAAAAALVAGGLVPPRVMGRPRLVDPRRVVAAINYRWRTGCGWRQLPPELPPWNTVYSYHRRWTTDGTLQRLRAVLDPPPGTEVAPKRRPVMPLPPKLNPNRDVPAEPRSFPSLDPRSSEP